MTGSDIVAIRRASADDADVISDHRCRMFLEAGRSESELELASESFRKWLTRKIAAGEYLGWIAHEGDRVIGSIGLMIMAWPPHPDHPADDRRAYILNLFVEKAARGGGLGTRLLDVVLNEAREHGIHYAFLHPTPAAEGLYQRLGWRGTGELKLHLADDGSALRQR